jgi:glycosyltransferase involved in cell wall biosynthesis
MLPFETAEMKRYGFSKMGIKVRALRHAQTFSFRKADGVIFVSQYARDLVEREVGRLPGACTVIPHGINSRFRFAPRPALEIDHYSQDRPFRWLYVSKVDAFKHQWSVIEALARLKKDGWPVALDLVGGTAYSKAARRMEEALKRFDPCGEFVRQHGEIPYGTIEDCYHRSDGAVFASSCESISIILLEKMAGGLPIACSNRGPMQEILGSAGVYFDPENPSSIAEACAQLMRAPSIREEKAAMAYRRALAYTWERSAGHTFSFLREVYQNSLRSGTERAS